MVERRGFIKKTVLTGGGMLLAPLAGGFSGRRAAPGRSGHTGGEILYNGIQLPEVWPPRNMDPESYDPMPVPYLDQPPQVIPVDTGRQLFVDDFLIEHTNLRRVFHRAVKYEGNPVLLPETLLEMGDDGLPLACPKDGGVWWDPDHGIFRMW